MFFAWWVTLKPKPSPTHTCHVWPNFRSRPSLMPRAHCSHFPGNWHADKNETKHTKYKHHRTKRRSQTKGIAVRRNRGKNGVQWREEKAMIVLTLSTLVWTSSIISMRVSAGMGSLDRTTGVLLSLRIAASCDRSVAICLVSNCRGSS